MKRIHLIGLAVLSALLLSAAWPERGFAPLIFVALVPLFFVQDHLGNPEVKSRRGSLFLLAFLTFAVWNTLTTWWIWNSTEIGAIAAIGLNSLFMTTVFWIFHYTKRKLYNNKKGFLILLFYWLSWELFHLDWDLSWPWLNLGHVFATRHTWIQWYEFTGVAGGTAWVILMNILVFNIIKALLNWKLQARRFGAMLILAVLLWMIPVLISNSIYSNYEEHGETAEVVVVQPNFDPYSEQYELPASDIIERNLSLAASVMSKNTVFIVSPESAIQDNIWLEHLNLSPSLEQLYEFIQSYPNISIVIGASTFSIVPEEEEGHHAVRKFRDYDAYYFAHNTAIYMDSTALLDYYHKSKLTPGVEMMPSWRILRPLQDYAIDLGGTVGSLRVDDERTVFEHSSGKFRIAPIICYESVYGSFVSEFIRNGANLIFVITNDGWWGNTPGHRQHFWFSVLRAIETRRSIARSANTGISAFIDQRGDVYHATPYWEPAVIRHTIITNDTLTFYVKYGDYLSRIAVFVSTIFLLTGLVRGHLTKRNAKLRNT
jgi:apolipoprotein N-acyltransferase